ncbi:MAG: type II secretion system F family protein [Clostridium sp.]
MAIYKYTAKNSNGDEVKGLETIGSIDELKLTLGDKGYFLTTVKEEGKSINISMGKKMKMKEFVIFCRQYSVILSSGLTILDGLNLIVQQTENQYFRQILSDIYESILKGKQLSVCFKEYPEVFPKFFVNMVQVGEATGKLDTVLVDLAEYYDKEYKMVSKVKKALMYPVIVVGVAVIIITVLMLFVLPSFTAVLNDMGAELPALTRGMIAISSFMKRNILIIILVIVLSVVAVRYYNTTKEGERHIDTLKLHSPFYGKFFLKVVTSKFARSMSLLLSSGVSITNAMEVMRDIMGNKIIEDKFGKCAIDIQEGKSISASVEKMGIFPPMLNKMLHVGENTGEMDNMLGRTADFFDDDVEIALEQMIALIEPALIISLAIIVGTIIMAVMLPMMSIMDSVM